MSARRRSRLEQRLTDDDRLVRLAIAVFGGLTVLVLLGLGASEFRPNWCARQMRERQAVNVVSTGDGGCELTFADGSVERLQPSQWAGYSLAAALAITVAIGVYLYATRRRGRRPAP